MANMSSGAFCKYFKKCNGITVTEYIRNKRIARAVDLIKSSDLTILDIALAVCCASRVKPQKIAD
jgi:AraC-like DNA-binding protein